MSGDKGQGPEQIHWRVMVRHVAKWYLSHKMYFKNAGNERGGGQTSLSDATTTFF
jgi:hypothetical protein